MRLGSVTWTLSEELLLVKYFITLETIKFLVDSGQISYKFNSMTQYIMSYDITVSKDGKKHYQS
jgi:hypothetical protein